MNGSPSRILLIDDDRLLGSAVSTALRLGGHEVTAVHTAGEGLAACERLAPDVVIIDEKLPDGKGHALCGPILEIAAEAKIIFITGYPSFDTVVRALKAGAHDYLSKPFELAELEHSVARALGTIVLEHARCVQRYRDEKEREESAVLRGATAPGLGELIDVATRADAPVLITGETGTGKSLAAKAIHHEGKRRKGPFVAINLASIPDGLVEAELFGWERGAFTGAVGRREGVIEMAERGTLFLDEIGEMPLALQAKLLAVLEDRVVRRLGGRAGRVVDVRIIAATNADLEDLVARRAFRSDLYFRLDVVRLHLPPLRERTDELPAIIASLLSQLAPRGRAPALASGEIDKLASYAWPGNIRELRNVLERALLIQHDALTPSAVLSTRSTDSGPPRSDRDAGADGALLTLAEVERRHIERALQRHDGNLTRAAAALGISLSTLKRRVGPRRRSI